ncbi:hypothetical protein A8U91_01110 [Halomonas elongata]|uniref:Uncharacterized protein n=1 Tax=Halomonas elongata TaxID=2746 RepID=A0A1B8P3J1_HALEL|nr:hypothetical protein [Halomonas elongata]OBX36763.1 hypothetical protein A8U91_01110 [Halomonas elongata]
MTFRVEKGVATTLVLMFASAYASLSMAAGAPSYAACPPNSRNSTTAC